MYHSFLIHSSADGHLGCFHVLTITNRSTQIYTLDPDGWLQIRPASPPTRTAPLQDEGGCGAPETGSTHLTEAASSVVPGAASVTGSLTPSSPSTLLGAGSAFPPILSTCDSWWPHPMWSSCVHLSGTLSPFPC